MSCRIAIAFLQNELYWDAIALARMEWDCDRPTFNAKAIAFISKLTNNAIAHLT
jgi:hypothetical protein